MAGAWKMVVVAVGILGAAGCASAPPARERIGVYDSRAVVIAAFSDKTYRDRLEALHASWKARLDAAKAAGDAKGVAQVEADARANQHRLHLQGFSTAPVEDVLDCIRDRLPGVRERAGVSMLVSKWDEATLGAHPSAERVDVTMLLVDVLAPDGSQREMAVQILAQPPIPLAEAEKMGDDD